MAQKKFLSIDDGKEILTINKKHLIREGFCVYATDSPSSGVRCAFYSIPSNILSKSILICGK